MVRQPAIATVVATMADDSLRCEVRYAATGSVVREVFGRRHDVTGTWQWASGRAPLSIPCNAVLRLITTDGQVSGAWGEACEVAITEPTNPLAGGWDGDSLRMVWSYSDAGAGTGALYATVVAVLRADTLQCDLRFRVVDGTALVDRQKFTRR